MAIQVAPEIETRYKFSIDQYEQMIEAGVFKEAERVELIDGEVLRMAARGLRHEACVRRLELLFHELLMRKVQVSTQNSVRIQPSSMPEPDLCLLKWRDDFYEGARPMPEDVVLLVEVSDSTLLEDRGRKRSRYAQAGVLEYWIINLQDDVIEVYSDPVGTSYNAKLVVRRGEVLALPGGFEGELAVNDVLGGASN